MLQGLDDAGWDALTHAYGPALDTPGLLRQAASADESVAAEARTELYGSLFHQDTVYPATVAAVGFLAGLAAVAPHGRDDLVWMLGRLADPEHAYGAAFPAVRAAVAAQGPTVVALLDDADDAVREAAAYAAAQAGAPARSLWQRWQTETTEPVRASLVLALGLVDPAGAGPVLAQSVVTGTPVVRVAAAVALLRAGLPWPSDTPATVVTAIDDGAVIPYGWAHGSDWADELPVTPPAGVAVDLVRQFLQAREPATRELGLSAAVQRCAVSRSAPVQVAPVVAVALHDPDAGVRRAATGALARIGAAAGRYADELAGLAAGHARTAGSVAVTAEYQAVGALARLGDVRWIDPVCDAAAAGHRAGRLLDDARLRPEVLAAVRERLAREPARADVLAEVLGSWQAREAVPELLTALPHAAVPVTYALLQIGHDDPAALPHLHARAQQFADPAAAQAIRRLTGDAQPLLSLLSDAMAQRTILPPDARVTLDDLGRELLPLLPAAHALLTGRRAAIHPQRVTQMLAARVVAAVDGVAPVLPTVRAVLAGGDTPARAAAELIADLAPAHRDALADLRPHLHDRLHDRRSRVAAARALTRLGVPVADLTEPLVQGITDHAGRFGLAAILELRAVATIPHLEKLTRTDHRLPPTGSADTVVWADERLVDRIRDTIIALRAASW